MSCLRIFLATLDRRSVFWSSAHWFIHLKRRPSYPSYHYCCREMKKLDRRNHNLEHSMKSVVVLDRCTRTGGRGLLITRHLPSEPRRGSYCQISPRNSNPGSGGQPREKAATGRRSPFNALGRRKVKPSRHFADTRHNHVKRHPRTKSGPNRRRGLLAESSPKWRPMISDVLDGLILGWTTRAGRSSTCSLWGCGGRVVG